MNAETAGLDVASSLIERCPLVSSDSHVLEPADLWSRRTDARFRDRAPRVVRVADKDEWHADGVRFQSIRGTAYQAGLRFTRPEDLSLDGQFEAIRPGALDPDAHVQDMDLDGVAGAVLYPTAGMQLYKVEDSDLLSACVRAYNDHVAEFCGHNPERLRGIAILNVDSVEESIRELERARSLGLAGALVPVGPKVRYDHPSYEPLWAAAEQSQAPLTLHIGTERGAPDTGIAAAAVDPVAMSAWAHELRLSLAALTFGGVFERHPKLKIVVAEFEISWAFYLLHRMDDTYQHRVAGLKGRRFATSALPSDFFRQNVYISFQEDAVGVQMRGHIGPDHLMWGADYPHAEATFPRSREIVDDIFEGVRPEEKVKMTRDNAARLYHFSLDS